MNSPYGDETFPLLSGAFDSVELTEKQQKLIDIAKSLGKMSLVVAESQAPFRVEKIEGLENFIYQLGKLQEANPTGVTREEIEKLEQDVRYEKKKEKIGNKTEFLRMFLHSAMGNQKIKQMIDEVIEEQIHLESKRSQNRQLAETASSSKIEN